MLFVDDELQQARRQSAQNHLPTDEFRKISMLVMSDRAWARVHSELLTKRLASEAT
jgi:hypothetical protein